MISFKWQVNCSKTLILKILVFNLGFSGLAMADENKAEALQKFILEDSKVRTNETIIEVGGKKFRKLEVEGKTYYFQLYNAENPSGDLQIECEKNGYLDSKPKILVARKLMNRTKVFIEGIKHTCKMAANGKGELGIDPAIQIGFLLPEDSTDLIKNKKIFFTPFGGAGFSGEW